MPVRRLRSLAEAERAVWHERHDPRLADAIRHVWALSDRLCAIRVPPGLHRHRSIDDANRLRESWDRERVRQRRGRTGR